MCISGGCRSGSRAKFLKKKYRQLQTNLSGGNYVWPEDAGIAKTCSGNSAARCKLKFSLLGRKYHAVCGNGKRRLPLGCRWKEIHRLSYGIWTYYSGAFVR